MATYSLYPEERERLDNWLQQWGIKLDFRTRHQFRDAMPVARLVDKVHKDLVDLSMYKECTSVPMMQNSWKIFKIHVLDGLNIGISDTDLEQLALGTDWERLINSSIVKLIPRTKSWRVFNSK